MELPAGAASSARAQGGRSVMGTGRDIKQRRRQQGLCADCGLRESFLRLCESCLEKQRGRDRLRSQSRKDSAALKKSSNKNQEWADRTRLFRQEMRLLGYCWCGAERMSGWKTCAEHCPESRSCKCGAIMAPRRRKCAACIRTRSRATRLARDQARRVSGQCPRCGVPCCGPCQCRRSGLWQ